MINPTKPCPFCGIELTRTGGPVDWEYQHAERAGEGCLLHAQIFLQDDDDVDCWNMRSEATT